MVKFYCDRCGIEIKAVPHNQRSDYYRIKKITRFDEFFDVPERETTTIHLCDDCQEDLRNFLGDKKKK